MNDFAALGTWLAPLLQQATPQQKARLMRRVSIELRKRNQARTRQQVDTDGNPFVPRASGDGQPMFRELTMARYFKTKATATTAEVGFAGSAGRIASVHQFGRTDVVNKYRSIRHQYPRRALVGINEEDQVFIESLVFGFLQN
jgi:phage virion morphogenesis protein